MQQRVLCIVGPTATGKTALAIQLSRLFPSILVSADSRQVYRGMDIVTGKDHPSGVTLHGIDLVDPAQSSSVSVWYDAVLPHISRSWEEGKLVIVVGGTGLYVRAITHGIATIQVPLNPSLRGKLSSLSISELQSQLSVLDSTKFQSLNHSDQNNPRRLIRAIEVALSPPSTQQSNIYNLESYTIGLQYSDYSNLPAQAGYRSVIHQRVLSRLRSGALAETKQLLTHASPQALTTLGYRSLALHLQGKLSYESMVEAWVQDELRYAKRQLTWFKKIIDVEWYDPSTLNFDQVASTAKAWYDRTNGDTE